MNDLIYEIPHGGSGPFGNSAYTARATGCLERARLERESPRSCADTYRPTAAGKPSAMLLGTMVHGLIELELGGADLGEGAERVTFVDAECEGFQIEPEWVAEAKRIYLGWKKVRAPWPAKLISSEETLDVELVPGVRVQAKLDALFGLPKMSGIASATLVDFKTSAKSGDFYSSGKTRLQMHLYCMAAWRAGYNVDRIEIRQITKTKEPKENIYEIDLPTPARENWILRYLRGALARERYQTGAFGFPGQGVKYASPRGAECDSCPFSLECTL